MSALSKQLASYIAEYGARPFDWRSANCCHFAAGWVERCTGVNPMLGLRETPNKFGALRLLHRLGGMSCAWSTQLDREPIKPASARVGDILLFDLGSGVMGICAGRTAAVALADGAIAFVPTGDASAAWRVAAC